MINYPHNPSGQIATEDWLHDLCAYCQQHDIRLFNDAAYAISELYRKECHAV